MKPETDLKCFNKSVISSALVGTEDDVLFEEHGSSGGDNSNGKCDSSDVDFRRLCYKKKLHTSLPICKIL